MGAWGTGSFENDDALDWLGGLEEHGVAQVIEALSAVAACESAPETTLCCHGLAAAEIVAAMSGRGADEPPQEVAVFVDDVPPAGGDLVAMARSAVQQIFEDSDLRELWEESEEWEEWEDVVGDLLDRLGQQLGA